MFWGRSGPGPYNGQCFGAAAALVRTMRLAAWYASKQCTSYRIPDINSLGQSDKRTGCLLTNGSEDENLDATGTEFHHCRV